MDNHRLDKVVVVWWWTPWGCFWLVGISSQPLLSDVEEPVFLWLEVAPPEPCFTYASFSAHLLHFSSHSLSSFWCSRFSFTVFPWCVTACSAMAVMPRVYSVNLPYSAALPVFSFSIWSLSPWMVTVLASS